MKTCCDEYCANHGCNQGDDCPIRTGKPVRKVKAGGPPPTELPPLPIELIEPERPSLVSLVLWVAVGFCAVMAALNFIVGVL